MTHAERLVPPLQRLAEERLSGGEVAFVLQQPAEVADREAADAAAEAQDAKAAQAARKRALSRNALVAENADGSSIKVEPPRLPYANSRKDAIRGPSVRFRDGQVSSRYMERQLNGHAPYYLCYKSSESCLH